ncbi:type VI secretion system protein TssA [Ideonella livida]|uniref:Type VI secretion system protein TssA n=1 Tax=Ideonella livida TaxID=2707176 RepID=A0A7C9PHG5_9BURK|nr:type VI secretion system protein TssA [Ideonella livida]NDY91350.1 type VI secretion system protein TssA [Ideonella livida]
MRPEPAAPALTPMLFEPDALLAPLAGPDPAGPDLRYDRVMGEIRLAREADDPSLPQGEWERPLKKADWPGVVLLCTHVLRERSKDLQVAAWLTDAWVHLYGLDGLAAGLTILNGLVAQHWDGLHPRVDADGDAEARAAPLFWLNEALALSLRLEVTLLRWPERKPPRIVLEDWDRSLKVEDQPGNPRRPKTPPPDDRHRLPPREELLRAPLAEPLAALQARREQVRQLSGEWARLDLQVDARLGRQGPSLARVAETLEQLGRALDALITPRLPPPAPPAEPEPEPQPEAGPPPAAWLRAAQNALENPPMSPVAPSPDTPAPTGAPAPGLPPNLLPLRHRQDAYAALEKVADFLQHHEPHSPTPYLIRRAVRWGRLPLPELMQELLREEGDVGRLMRLLGGPEPS